MSTYPAHWWLKIEDSNKPEWEILPHQANTGEVILSKRNELGVLSNLALTPFQIDGIEYDSIESLWQCCKLPDSALLDDPRQGLPFTITREQMRTLTGLEGKRKGDEASAIMKANGINWVSYQGKRWGYPESEKGPFYQLIRRAMEEKYRTHHTVREILHQTDTLILKPDHTSPGPLSPAHRYFEIWMEIRQARS